MRLSIVISTAGNDHFRDRNFNECIRCINEQTFKDYEVIIVEQSLDGRFYKNNKGYKYIPIKDPGNRGFNLSWSRNVGAREAEGDIIVLMDSDFVFEKDYFKAINEFSGNFVAGAETYYWCNMEDPTVEWLKHRDFNYFRSRGAGPKDPIFKFKSMTRGCGFGAILVYNKNWFWNVFGGYNENFFRYGWEDKAATETIKVLLGKNDESMDRIQYEAAHLSHRGKDIKNMRINESLYNSFSTMNQFELSNKIKISSMGKEKPQH